MTQDLLSLCLPQITPPTLKHLELSTIETFDTHNKGGLQPGETTMKAFLSSKVNKKIQSPDNELTFSKQRPPNRNTKLSIRFPSSTSLLNLCMSTFFREHLLDK